MGLDGEVICIKLVRNVVKTSIINARSSPCVTAAVGFLVEGRKATKHVGGKVVRGFWGMFCWLC